MRRAAEPDLGQRPGEHAGQDEGQDDAGDGRHDGRGHDDRHDRLVVHRLGVIGRIAGFDHQLPEDVGPDHGDADPEDGQPDPGRHEGCKRDSGRDPAADHGRAVR